MKFKISVVIATHNRADRLMSTVDSVTGQSFRDYEIIVVDDGSTDSTKEKVATLAKKSSRVKYFKQKQSGPAAARNLGIKKSQGDIVAFTDDDCIAPADWLEKIAAAYERFPHIAGVGGYVKPIDDELKRSIFAQLEWVEAVCTYGVEMKEKSGCESGAVGGTSNMSYRKSVLDEVGGFDEHFRFAGGEDTDLKVRICSRGHKLLYIPVGVTHNRSYSFRGFLAQTRARGIGGAYFRAKHGMRWGFIVDFFKIILSPILFIRSLVSYKLRCGLWHARVAAIKSIGVVCSSVYSIFYSLKAIS
jgi:glycosyltransferase involved in cell wall biosynthesis